MKSAQLYLQQGQYSRAAESFALACMYDSRDARPQIGRSHALLAAGEYLGSAICLAKAIELDPRYTLQKLDLLEAVGGPDRFVQRFTDLKQRRDQQCPGAATAVGVHLPANGPARGGDGRRPGRQKGTALLPVCQSAGSGHRSGSARIGMDDGLLMTE